MDKRCKEAMFAVAFCTLIGPFVGWCAESYLGWHQLPAWLAAIVVSGFVVYLACDLPGLKAAIPKAWKYAVERSPWTSNSLTRRRWKLLLWHLPRALFAVNVLWSSLTLPIVFAMMINSEATALYPLLIMPTASSLVALVLPTLIFTCAGKNEIASISKELRATYRSFVTKGNPIKILFYWLPVGLYSFCRYRVPIILAFVSDATCFGARFVGRLYILIHTQLRVLALADTALFVGVFYFTYSPVWAVVAAVLGSAWFGFNYMWIAKRALNVQPI